MDLSPEVHRACFFFASAILLAGVVVGISISGMIQKSSTFLVMLDKKTSQLSLSTLFWMRAGWIFICFCIILTQYLMFESALETVADGREPVSTISSFLINMILLLIVGLQTLPEFKWQKRQLDNQKAAE